MLALLAAPISAHDASGATGPGVCSNDNAAACSVDADCGVGNSCYLPTAGGQTLANQVCMETAANKGLNCTANDVNIAQTTNLTYTPCQFPNDTTTISFVAEFDLTAQARYDVGVWVAQDGGDALTGTCSVSNFPISPDPLWLNLDAVSQPTDTCGDIDANHDPLYSSIQNIQVACVDTNGDGLLDVSTCLSWREPGANDICTSPLQAFPGAPSKCNCETLPGIAIPVPGEIIVDKVTSPAGSATVFDFVLSGGPTPINQPFTLTDAQTPFDSGGLPLGTYAVAEGAEAGWTLSSATCTSNQAGRTPTPGNIVLHNGEIVTCTFNNVLIPTPTPSPSPSPTPTPSPSPSPTPTPTPSPSPSPTPTPTPSPSPTPTPTPTPSPSPSPTPTPTPSPSPSPTATPTPSPSPSPSPTPAPSPSPSPTPTPTPSPSPSPTPTPTPSPSPSATPTSVPTGTPIVPPTPTPFPTPTPEATSTALPTPTEVCHHTCPDKLVLAGGIGLADTVSVASVGKLDHLTVRSAFPTGAIADVLDGVRVTLSNANGVIYTAELLPGDLIQRGSSLVFLDREAKKGNGIRGGIAKVKIQPVPKIGGVRVLIDAFGHMGAATQDTMTLTIVVGNDANGITDSWELKSYGWTRIHR